MPHAPDDAPPRHKRKPPPPPRRRPADTTYLPHGGPVHDEPPDAPPPTYGHGRITTPSSTLDQILSYGAGPLNLEVPRTAGKIDIPLRPHAPPPRLVAPFVNAPAAGEHTSEPPPTYYPSLFGKHGATLVPPATQAMLEHATGDKHQHDQANYLMAAVDLEQLNQRAHELGVIDGTPLGNLVRDINTAVGEPTHQIAGFPETGRTALPSYVRSILLDRIRHVEHQTGLSAHLDQHATDADIVRASFGGHHHDSYWDIARNLPRDLVETPLYSYQGGVALGSAVGYAAHGNLDPLREVAAQQVDAFRHPGAFVQQHPFQAFLAASGLAKGVGRVTARARGLAEEPRTVATRSGAEINRGVSPANDYIRGVQGIQDYLTRPHEAGGLADRLGLNRVANRLQDQGLRKNVRQAQARERARVQQEQAPLARDLAEAAGGLTARQRGRVLGNEAMGVTPDEMAAFRGETPPGAAPLTDAQQAYLDAAGAYRGHSENVMENELGLLGSGARLHRNVDPLAQVLADQGHPLATRYLEVNDELSTLQQQLERTPHGDPKVQTLTDRIAALQKRRAAAAERLLSRMDTQIETLRKTGRSSEPATEAPSTPLTSELERQIARERRAAESSYQTQMRGLERQLARMKQIRAKTAPGKRPLRKGTPGQIQALTNRLEQLRANPPIDETTGAYTSPRVRTLEQRLSAARDRALGSANRGADEMRRLEERRSNLLRSQVPVGDVTSPQIERLQQQLQATPTRGILEGQIGQAFADRNDLLNRISSDQQTRGMNEPFRVPLEREQQREGFFGSRSTGSPAGVKRRGVRPYTGALFRSGEYKPPTHEAFVRDLEAPLNAQGYHRLVNHITDPNEGLAHLIQNTTGEDIPIGEDVVVVKRAPDEPGRQPENFKPGESFASRLDYQTDHVPPGGEALVVPRSVAKQLVAGGKTIDQGRTLDRRVSQALRNALLYSRGVAYSATNLQGNIVQNLLEDVGPVSYARAMRRTGNRLPIPPGVEEGGAARTNFTTYESTWREALDADTRAKVVAGLLGSPVRVYLRSMYSLARNLEDMTRRAAYYKKAVPLARVIAHPDDNAAQHFGRSVSGVTDQMREVLEAMARGDGPQEVQTAAASAMQSMNRVLGDWASMPSNRVVDFLVPFHRWVQFATRLLVVSLPLHYPGKALLLYRLGSLGQDLQNQLGPLTPANQGIVPIGGSPQDQLVFGTAYPNSFATLADALATDQRGGSQIFGLNPVRGLSYLSPYAQLAIEGITGRDPETGRILTNPQNEGVIASDRDHPADPEAGTDALRLALAQALGLISPLRLIQPQNAADTSVPIPGLTQAEQLPQPPAWAAGTARGASPQTTLPLSREQNIFNLLSPFKLKRLNLDELARQGVQQVSDRTAATQRAETR